MKSVVNYTDSIITRTSSRNETFINENLISNIIIICYIFLKLFACFCFNKISFLFIYFYSFVTCQQKNKK